MSLDANGRASAARPERRILVWSAGSDASPVVAGLPLWRRAVYGAARAGFDRILLVAGSGADEIRASLAGDRRLVGHRLDVVATSEGWVSTLSGDAGRWVVWNDQWIVDGALLVALGASASGTVAASPDGPFATSEEDLVRWLRNGWRPFHPPLVPVESRFPRPTLYVRVGSAASVAAAEDALFASLGRSDDNVFARRVDRALSRAVSRRLARTAVTPNQITLASIAVGITGALVLLDPAYWAGFVGTLLFLVSTILDGSDGEIARLKFEESALGAKLDLFGDNVVHAFLFPCLALRFWIGGSGAHFVVLGIITLAGAVASWIAVWKIVLRPDPAWGVVGFFHAFANREFAYGLFALGVIGRLEWFVWVMTVGIWVFPAGLWILHLADRARRGAHAASN